MTLNLILTSKDAVYLSGDFRLTSIKDQAALPDSYDTQKLIPVIRRDWAALIAYMGVACAPPLVSDMGQWIAEQMDAIPVDGSFADISKRLFKLNEWLGRIRGDRRIALSIVGFSDQKPFVMLISNFIDLHGRMTEGGIQLRAYLRRSSQPEVRAVGTVRPDVFERVRLQRLLQANSSRRLPQLIRHAVAEINANVARRSRGSISEECVTGYLLSSGSGAIGVHGIPENAACFPNWVRRDLERGGVIGFEPANCNEGKVGPVQWKGTTTRTFNKRMVRIHEIANAGKPILDGSQHSAHSPTSKSLEADTTLGHLGHLLQRPKMMKDPGPSHGESHHVVVLGGDDAIRVVKCSG